MHDVNAGKKEKKKDDTTDRWTQLHWLFHYVCLEICGPGIHMDITLTCITQLNGLSTYSNWSFHH